MRVVWLGWEEIYTSRRVKEAASQLDLGLDIYDIHDLTFMIDGQNALVMGGGINLLETYDGLVVRTFYPYISEALTLARLFRESGRVVMDSSLTDEGYAVSKMHDHLVMVRHGIPCPRTWQIFNPRQVEATAEKITYPCLLKGVHGARGDHVYLVQNPDQLERRLWHYPCGELMLQEYLPAEEDYRIMVIGYKAMPVMVSRKPPKGDFRTNYALGSRFYRREMSEFPECKEIAENAARVLRREFTAVDIRLKEGLPVVLEVNRQPDFEGFERATKFDVASEVVKHIKRRLSNLSAR